MQTATSGRDSCVHLRPMLDPLDQRRVIHIAHADQDPTVSPTQRGTRQGWLTPMCRCECMTRNVARLRLKALERGFRCAERRDGR